MPRVRLLDLCHARSGDKGKHCNIGVIAWKPEYYPVLERELTPARVKAHFGDLVRGEVRRYELPNLQALNFVVEDALDGGGTRSLRLDAQGKAMCEALLMMEIEVEEAIACTVSPRAVV